MVVLFNMHAFLIRVLWYLQIPMAPKQAHCYQTQRLRLFSGEHAVFETTQIISGIPMGDLFKVESRWDITASPGDSASCQVCRPPLVYRPSISMTGCICAWRWQAGYPSLQLYVFVTCRCACLSARLKCAASCTALLFSCINDVVLAALPFSCIKHGVLGYPAS